MEILQKLGHYGDIALGAVGPIAIILLKKAPLKYYEDLDALDKTKADVVFAYINLEWKFVGTYSIEDSPDKLENINHSVSELHERSQGR